MAYTYILSCCDGALYVGSTTDLDLRLDEHARGAVDSYTSKRRPVTLVWFREFEHAAEAALFERTIKQWHRAKKLALIEGRFEDLPALARSGTHRTDRRPPST